LFLLSKLLSALTSPVIWLAALLLLALWWIPRRPTWAQRCIALCLALAGLLGFQAGPDALLRPLEARYSVPAEPPNGYAGLIVLGGAVEDAPVFLAHGQVALNDGAERMTMALPLMRQHPLWRLVFSGGDGRLLGSELTEAALAQKFFVQQGLEPQRLLLEDRSRTTRENARLTAKLLGAECQRPWLLLTSAWHMPRAMAEFEHTGCHVTPYPVDFLTGGSTPLTEYAWVRSMRRWQVALHEWVGLAAYALTR